MDSAYSPGTGRDQRNEFVAFFVEVARGHSGSPTSWLGAIADIAYLAAVIRIRVRR